MCWDPLNLSNCKNKRVAREQFVLWAPHSRGNTGGVGKLCWESHKPPFLGRARWLSQKGACHQAWQPAFNPWDPHSGRWKLTPTSCPLTSTCLFPPSTGIINVIIIFKEGLFSGPWAGGQGIATEVKYFSYIRIFKNKCYWSTCVPKTAIQRGTASFCIPRLERRPDHAEGKGVHGESSTHLSSRVLLPSSGRRDNRIQIPYQPPVWLYKF